MDDSECRWCSKSINFSKDKWCCLNTYQGKKNMDINNFHFDCFNEWFALQLEEKAKALYIKTMRDISPQVASMVKSIVQNPQ